MTPPSAPTTTTEQSGADDGALVTGKPCDIVGCVVDARVVKSERLERFDACVIPGQRMRPASEHIVGRISEHCHIFTGGDPVKIWQYQFQL